VSSAPLVVTTRSIGIVIDSRARIRATRIDHQRPRRVRERPAEQAETPEVDGPVHLRVRRVHLVRPRLHARDIGGARDGIGCARRRRGQRNERSGISRRRIEDLRKASLDLPRVVPPLASLPPRNMMLRRSASGVPARLCRDRRRLPDALVDMVRELREIVDEQVHQLLRGDVELDLVVHVSRGFRIAASTPGTDTGTWKPKFGSVRNSAPFSDPSSAALSSARVALIGMRLPTRNLPPVQPVLTSQHDSALRSAP
jgi:hypothetical protein